MTLVRLKKFLIFTPATLVELFTHSIDDSFNSNNDQRMYADIKVIINPLRIKLDKLWKPDSSARKLIPKAEYPMNFKMPYWPSDAKTKVTVLSIEIIDIIRTPTILILIKDCSEAISLVNQSGPKTM